MSLILGGVVLATALLDRAVAEPPRRIHPVALFGRLVAPLDREWRGAKLVGAGGAVVLPVTAAGVVGLAVWLAGNAWDGGTVEVAGVAVPVGGVVVATLALFSVTSHRLLCATAANVVGLSARDLPRARTELRALAGRESGSLTDGEVRSAAVESSAENLADGLIAPLFGYLVGALAVGLLIEAASLSTTLAVATATAVWVKAVNTMDSMLGYRSKPVGWASARLDDAVMWVPARLAALALSAAAVSPDPILTARRWADRPPSPNGGWPMATLAAALGVRLEKPGVYVLNDVASLPTVAEGRRGATIVRRAGWLAFLTTAVIVSV